MTAFEKFLTYPTSVETTEIPVTVTVVPYVTLYEDGSKQTSYKTVTETLAANATASAPPPKDPYATLTWVVDDVTL